MDGKQKTDEEKVRTNIELFENRLPKKYLDLIMGEGDSGMRHPLFNSLCHPLIYPRLTAAINIIKERDKEKYLPKILSKLLSSSGWWEQQLVIFEIIIAAFYFKKFKDSKETMVEWERKFPSGEKRSGISIIGADKDTIRIEVIKEEGLSHDKRFQLMDKLQALLEKNLSRDETKYLYIISLPESQKGLLGKYFTGKDITRAAEFISRLEKEREGKYFFPDKKNRLLEIDKKEYSSTASFTSRFDIVSSFLKENKRLRNAVKDTACSNLLFEEINFIFLPDFGGMEDKDVSESFLGEEDRKSARNGAKPIFRRPTGAVNVTDQEGCATVHGLIHSSLNYSAKKIIYNPLSEIEEKIIGLIN